MFIRSYLRASTHAQDASRAKQSLQDFAKSFGKAIACEYMENASGTSTERRELRRLLCDAQSGDILLVESIDRLSRLPANDWKKLRSEIDQKGLRVVALDLPTSHQAMRIDESDEFTNRMLDAVNSMMLDMMAAIARKDYEQRRERQRQGITNAKADGKYKGRPIDSDKHKRITELLIAGFSIRKTAKHAGASTYTVQKVKTALNSAPSDA